VNAIVLVLVDLLKTLREPELERKSDTTADDDGNLDEDKSENKHKHSNDANGQRQQRLQQRGNALMLLSQLVRCSSQWPLGLEGGLKSLRAMPPDTTADQKAFAKWDAACSHKILRNSTWMQFCKQLTTDTGVRDCLAQARESRSAIVAEVEEATKAVLHRAARFDAKIMKESKELEAQRFVAGGVRSMDEMKRRSALDNRVAVSRRIRLRALQHILRNLSNERGPWCPFSDTDREHGTGTQAHRRTRTASPPVTWRKRHIKIAKVVFWCFVFVLFNLS
jgi:hypothetical protein